MLQFLFSLNFEKFGQVSPSVYRYYWQKSVKNIGTPLLQCFLVFFLAAKRKAR